MADVPLMDFSALGDLPATFIQARKLGRDQRVQDATEAALKNLPRSPDGAIDFTALSGNLLSAGNLPAGVSFAQLGQHGTPAGYRRNNDGSLSFIPGGPQDPNTLKAIKVATAEAVPPELTDIYGPDGQKQKALVNRNNGQYQPIGGVHVDQPKLSPGDITKLSDEGGKLQNVAGFTQSFKPEFGGMVPGTGDFNNWVGRTAPSWLTDARTQDMAAWWQGYDRYKNAVRHELFGGALTANEQAAFEKADINNTMSPEQIKKNLETQSKIIKAGVTRKASSMIAAGYDAKTVAAAYGLQPHELGVDPNLARTPNQQNILRGPQQNQQQFKEGQTATGQNGQKIIFRGGQWVPLP